MPITMTPIVVHRSLLLPPITRAGDGRVSDGGQEADAKVSPQRTAPSYSRDVLGNGSLTDGSQAAQAATSSARAAPSATASASASAPAPAAAEAGEDSDLRPPWENKELRPKINWALLYDDIEIQQRRRKQASNLHFHNWQVWKAYERRRELFPNEAQEDPVTRMEMSIYNIPRMLISKGGRDVRDPSCLTFKYAPIQVPPGYFDKRAPPDDDDE